MLSPQTIAEYEREWTRFAAWTETQSASPLPAAPDLVAEYLDTVATSEPVPSLSTVRRIKAAIDHMHDEAGYPKPSKSPEVKQAWDRIRHRRTKGSRVTGNVLLDGALTPTQRAMIIAQPDTALGTRDRALLLLGLGAGLRPAELVALETNDVDLDRRIEFELPSRGPNPVGVSVPIPGGERVHVYSRSPDLDPAKHLSAWMRIASRESDHDSERDEGSEQAGQILFRGIDRHGNVSENGLTLAGLGVVVRRAAELAGLDDPSSFTPSSVFTERLVGEEL
jgi:integrase